MGAMLALAGLAFTAVFVGITVLTIGLVLKTVLRLLLLPLLLVKFLVTGILMLIADPVPGRAVRLRRARRRLCAAAAAGSRGRGAGVVPY